MFSFTLSKADVQSAYTSAQKVVATHRALSTWLRPGMTLPQIDTFVAQTLDSLDCKSCFKGYRVPGLPPFPSHACLSLNACVVHGTATSSLTPLKYGDVLKIDIGVTHRGWIGDAGWTYTFGPPSDQVARLMACGKEALRRGIAQIKPTNRWIEFARAVQTHVETECNFFNIEGLGGHGYGRKLHAPPFVANSLPSPLDKSADAYKACLPGTLVAVEPMIGAGTGKTRSLPNQWPVFTADNSMSVHYEHDILVTDDGCRVLTEGLEDLQDIIQ